MELPFTGPLLFIVSGLIGGLFLLVMSVIGGLIAVPVFEKRKDEPPPPPPHFAGLHRTQFEIFDNYREAGELNVSRMDSPACVGHA